MAWGSATRLPWKVWCPNTATPTRKISSSPNRGVSPEGYTSVGDSWCHCYAIVSFQYEIAIECLVLAKSRVRTNRHNFNKPEGLLLFTYDATTTALPKTPTSVVTQRVEDMIPDHAPFQPYEYLHSNELMDRAKTQPPRSHLNNLPANIQLAAN